MSMEINGRYNYVNNNYAEQQKTKYLDQMEKAKETQKEENNKKVSDQSSKPEVAYISSEKSGEKPNGLYRVGEDENGNRKIFYEDPNKSNHADGKQQPKVNADKPEQPEEKCVANSDKVEREIRKLKEKKQQLEQQIRTASGDEKKVKELEKKLAQVENELSQKDNDTYRRQNTTFSKAN